MEAQKQVFAGLRALDGDQQRALAPGRVVRVAKAIVQEDAILDGQCREVARAHAEEGERRRFGLDLADAEALLLAPHLQQRLTGSEEERLERPRAVDDAEDLGRAAGLEAIVSGLLPIAQAARQVGRGPHLVEDDGPVLHHRTDDAKALVEQAADQVVEPRLRQQKLHGHDGTCAAAAAFRDDDTTE